VVAAVVGTFVLDVFVRGHAVIGMGPVVAVYRPLAAVSVACTAVLVGGALFALLKPFTWPTVVAVLRTFRWRRVALAAAAFVVPAVAVRLLSRGQPLLPTSMFWHTIVIHGSGRPLVAPVAHVAYFGPPLLLLGALGGRYLGVLRGWGAGALLATAATVVLALTPESRQALFNVPLVVVPLCVAADRAAVRPAVVACLAVLALAFSKFWLVLNTPAALALTTWDPERQGAAYARYFANYGLYMPNRAYALHVAAVAASAALLAAAWRRGRRAA
jgi:hypothetical protein